VTTHAATLRRASPLARMLRLLGVALGLPVLAWVVVCVLMYLQQRELLYLGGFTRVDAAATNFALPRDDDITLRGWVVNSGASDVLLYFGGNAEDISHMDGSLRSWLPQRTSYLLAYRGYGASDGAPAQDLLFADALALYDAVAARHPGARIAAIGRSLGSGVAAYLAAHRPVEKLVLVTPFDSMVAVAGVHYPWLPTSLLVTERYESARWLRDYRGPVLVIRAGRDAVVPPANTDRLIAALPQAPQVLALPTAGHNDVLVTPTETAALMRFLAPGGAAEEVAK
jgi:pimeloyl-ACP methyl ester carboxylesterase